MMRNLLIVFGFIISLSAFSQDKIDFDYSKDYDSILKLTKDSKSEIFYKDLYERFENADTTLTNFELVALQIGYTDNPKYYPYQDVELEAEILSLIEKQKFKRSKKKLNKLLSNNPFNILGHRGMSYVQNKLGNEEIADLHYKKFSLIVASVLSTGDGTSYETSWFTLSPSDGQWIIEFVFRQDSCFMGSGSDDNGNFHDILGIKLEDSEDCKKLYFNIDPAAKRMFGKEYLNIEELNQKTDSNKKGKVKKKKRKNKK